MLRSVFRLSIAILAFAASIAIKPATARTCTNNACVILNQGHVRGRIPVACVPIPYAKEGWGKVAIFVLRDFNPQKAGESPEGLQGQLDNALRHDSKVTGPLDNFCRNAKFFEGGTWVVLCDGRRWGAITGGALAYAIRNKRAWHNLRVLIGMEVPIPKG